MHTDLDSVASVAAAQDGVITARQCLAAGMAWEGIIRRCRSGQWRVLFRGVYFLPAGATAGPAAGPAAGPTVPVRARIRAGLLATGPASTAVLTSAGHLCGLPYLPEDPAVQVSVPGVRNRLDQPGLAVRQLVIPDRERQLVDGMPTTSPTRTVADLVLRLRRADAVALVDGALRCGSLTEADRHRAMAMLRGRRGAVRGRRSLTEADGRADSPLETRIRLVCLDGGLPPEELQYVVRDELGHILAVGDLAWPSRRVIAEADGALVHGTAEALYHDRHRQNELAARGWTVIRFTWADLGRPGYVVGAIRRALAAAAAAPVPR